MDVILRVGEGVRGERVGKERIGPPKIYFSGRIMVDVYVRGEMYRADVNTHKLIGGAEASEPADSVVLVVWNSICTLWNGSRCLSNC